MAGRDARLILQVPGLLAALAWLATLGAGCTAQSGPARTVEALQVGDRVVSLPPASANELLFLKNDPVYGDRWGCELELKNPLAPKKYQWEIRSAPIPLSDRRADGNYISHLLDSLGDLGFVSRPREQPLELLGLNPPRFTMRWMQGPAVEEIRIGAPAVRPGEFYALVPRLSAEKPVIVRGSFLAVLAELSSFSKLRQRSWGQQGPDDFDEIELRRKGKSVFYAQRERDIWTNRAHEPVPVNAKRLLEQIVLSPIEEYIDEPKAAAQAAQKLQTSPDIQAVLTDREGQSVVLSVRNKESLVLSSLRPQAPFRLKAGVMEALRQFSN